MTRRTITGMMLRILLGIGLCVVLTTFSVKAQNHTGQLSKARNQALLENTDDHGNTWNHDPIVFSRRDLRTIRDYYSTHSPRSPRVGERGGNLSPTQRRQIERERTVSVVLERDLRDLPEELERTLTPLDPAYRRVAIGTTLLIVETHSQRITDIFYLAPNKR